jgi:hypothetical protein
MSMSFAALWVSTLPSSSPVFSAHACAQARVSSRAAAMPSSVSRSKSLLRASSLRASPKHSTRVEAHDVEGLLQRVAERARRAAQIVDAGAARPARVDQERAHLLPARGEADERELDAAGLGVVP